MTREQGWVLIIIIAFAVGWFVKKDMDEWPTQTESALDQHRDLMKRFKRQYGETP